MVNKDRSQVGITRDLIIQGGTKEIEVAKLFSRHFRITFSKATIFKSSQYIFNFLKPTDNFRERFNLHNEVLLLFSYHDQFDNRSLDFVDKTLYEFNNRLDKICIVLVCNDEKIEEKLARNISENKESRIIVPFTYGEIYESNLSPDSLECKFRKYFYSRDLFALESPLKSDNYFFGRSQIIQSLYDKYCMGENAGLFGLRKVGKTSVLFGLERMIDVRQGCSLMLDCQEPSVHKLRWNELLAYIIQKIKNKYSVIEDLIALEGYTEKEASIHFEQDLSKLSESLKNSRILIILDEIEHIAFSTSSSPHWRDDLDYLYFWQAVRAVFQRNRNLFCFTMVGVNPLCIEQPLIFNKYDNPIFSLLNPTYLNLFSIADVQEMITSIGKYMGLSFDKEIFSRLTDDYGGHPFLIRHVCSLINSDLSDMRPCEVSKYTYKDNKESYDNRIQNYIEMIISVLQTWYPQEYGLLETLVVHGNEEFKKQIRSLGNIIEHLTGYGIVKQVNGNFYVTINAVEKFIEVRSNKHKVLGQEDKWAAITVRRNNLEIDLRRIVRTVLMVHKVKGAKEEVLKGISEKRRGQLAEFELKALFDELFLLDLKQVMNRQWSYFERFFNDKTKFNAFIDTINEYRVDAHAKQITEDDYEALLYAIRQIESMIRKTEL